MSKRSSTKNDTTLRRSVPRDVRLREDRKARLEKKVTKIGEFLEVASIDPIVMLRCSTIDGVSPHYTTTKGTMALRITKKTARKLAKELLRRTET